MNAWHLPPNPVSSTQLTVWITTGRLAIAWLSGGGLISRLSWYGGRLGALNWVFNVLTVSVRPRPHHEAQRVQEAFPRSDAGEKSVCCYPTIEVHANARRVQRYLRSQKI